MGLSELTPDEHYLRSYYLQSEEPFRRSNVGELLYVLPALLMAGLSLRQDSADALWLAFVYLFGLYLWRCCATKWARAFRSLLQKYEAALSEANREPERLVDV